MNGMKMYPKRECSDCAHVIDIMEDTTGRDLITCELDECEPDRCEFYPCKGEPDVFKRCPICGARLEPKDLQFADIDGLPMGDMISVADYEDIKNPVNAMYPEERAAAEQRDDKEFIDESEDIYAYACEQVEYLVLGCRCGYQFSARAEDAGYPDKSWLNRFADKANRRA